jgi:crossover junction endodeoxyribonuclease RuvC
MKKSQQGKPSPPDESQSHTRSVKDGQSTRIVGFDPGLNITGYGVIEVLPNQQVQLVEAGTIRPKSKDDIQDRLHVIHSGVREILETFAPQSMAIEQLFVHVRFPKTAILMGHARGVICLAAAQAGIELHHYLPNRVKSMLTGSGHAGKEQMQLAVQRELRLKTRPEPADAADALAIALADFYLRLRALPGTQAQFRDNT